MKNKYLFFGGLLSGPIYLVGDIVGGIITPKYNYISNAASELIQTGVENRLPLSFFFLFHALAIIMMGLGLMKEYPMSKSKAINFGGIMLLAIGISHSLSGTIFAMDPVGTEATTPGLIHLILVGVSVIAIFMLFPLIGHGFYKLNDWRGFKIYTYISLAIVVISGFASPIIINNELPYMGLSERITGYVFYIWLFVLSYKLVKKYGET